jgi:Protein of unknown function (DUF1003)
MQDGGAEPLACQEGQLDLQAALAHGMPEGVFGLADPVLDTVLVQDEPFRGGLEAAVLLQEDAESVAQPGIMVVVGGQRPQGLVHPGPQQLDRARHQGQRRDLGEAGQPLPRGTRGQRDRLGALGPAVGATEAGQASARIARPRPGIILGVEHYPYGLLTMIVSLEAIFLSTFVMISQNRADAKRQVLADHQWQTVQEE